MTGSGLVEFLQARLGEREAIAKAAVIPAHDGSYRPHGDLSRWCYDPDGEVYYDYLPPGGQSWDRYTVTCDHEGLSPSVTEEVGPHIAANDPAYVLADVAAKRRIIELHADGHECSGYDGGEIDRFQFILDGEACATLRLLALPFKDHPDWQEDWNV